jgi:hypothetical protein
MASHFNLGNLIARCIGLHGSFVATALSFFVILTKRATRAAGRISDSGAQAPPVTVLRRCIPLKIRKERCAISETGTGFACAKLSEVLPPLALLRSSG